MKIFSRNFALAAAGLVLSAIALPAQAAPGHLTVQVDRPGVKISPIFNGLMIEDISHSIDGGLYVELIQNRNFMNDANAPVHWAAVQEGGVGTITLDKDNPVPGTVLTNCLRLDITKAGAGSKVGAANEGYWGMPNLAKQTYHASFYAKCAVGTTGILSVGIESSDGKTEEGRPQSVTVSNQWAKYNVTLRLGATTSLTAANRFVISSPQIGTFWLSQVSLMPTAYKNRPNGARVDIMSSLAGMKPRFLRLPGGNYLEGNTVAERFDWKKTIGDISQRPGHQDPWGYRSTDGFGLLEYLEWCEDLKMQPLLAVFAGYALGGEYVPAGPKLTPYVQDALDEIEYVTGGPDTTWGARRIADGHLAPFPLRYVEVGNEDNFDKSLSYDGRYAQFYDAIKAKYPNLQIIATMGVKGHVADVVDDHYYRSAVDMARDSRHYDGYSRTGPKIFVGEWASVEGSPTPTLQAALGDAAWLTGLERNSDLVIMESYAPLLVNINPGASQWVTNLIGLNATGIYNSPSYYVQSMFAANTGDVVLPITLAQPTKEIGAAAPMPLGKIGLGTWETQAEYKDIKVTSAGKTLYQKDFVDGAADWTLGKGEWKTQDGTFHQMGLEPDSLATAGDANWGDYTYTLKARKISGKEGFLIQFHVKDEASRVIWNIGGWRNVRTALQRFSAGAVRETNSVPMVIETGRWYDIKIEVSGRSIRCSLDGKLITESTDTPPDAPESLYATASRDLKTGDIILKVVNTGADPQPIQIDLSGVSGIAKTAIATVLVGEPGDVNTMSSPQKIAPRSIIVSNVGKSFLPTFPAHSVTVLRVKTR